MNRFKAFSQKMAIKLQIAAALPSSDNSTGEVHILELQSRKWVVLSKPFYGTQQGEEFGYSVDLSFDGNILASLLVCGITRVHEAGEGNEAM